MKPRTLFLISFVLLLAGCFNHRDLAGLGPLPEIQTWFQPGSQSRMAAYPAHRQCRETAAQHFSAGDARDKAIADCMYAKGFRFNPDIIGWCRRKINQDSYICRHRKEYDPKKIWE
ncbi:hypothetical protein [Neisseria animalis]|uniref:hypothetical protein n=1 Tax=Neisseria animalis TaxID=492 RepID=UPI000F4F2B08|nr:hypothetical protein [Neisseria animalis]